MTRKFFILAVIVAINNLCAQVATNRWKQHFSFNTIVDVKSVDDDIYAATTNAVFVYNQKTNNNEIFTTVDGLSGNEISKIFVIQEQELIFIGYKNGLLEIINRHTREVKTIADILLQTDLPRDELDINNFYRDENSIYVSTNFGIVTYSLSTNNFDKTIQFSSNAVGGFEPISDVSTSNNSIFAALKNGEIHQASLSSNLSLSTSWSVVQNIEVAEFIELEKSLFAISDNKVFKLNPNSSPNPFDEVASFPTPIINSLKNNSSISIVTNNNITSIDTNLDIKTIDLAADLVGISNFSVINDDNIILAVTGLGLNLIDRTNFDSIKNIGPSGPSDNNIFRISAVDGDIWGVYGSYENRFEIAQLRNIGPSRFTNNTWTNLPSPIALDDGILSHVIINPRNKNQVFVTSYRSSKGLYEYANGNLINEFSFENSNLEISINAGGAKTSVTNGTYDNQGNLWLINAESLKLLKQFSKNINDDSINFHPFIIDPDELSIGNSDLVGEDLDLDENGNIFAGIRRNGILGYQRSTGKLVTYSRQAGNNDFGIPVTAMKIDLTNNLWFGSGKGIRVMKDPSRIFDGELDIVENIVFENENGVAREFLSSIQVTDIEIDAENNKWIGTNGSGVFFVSPDGLETFNIFTATNSPLPSDNINDITIDSSNGAVFIATDKGLMEFSSTIIEAEENFDNFKIFPNPVRPEYGDVSVQIQGLTAGAVVKITDIVGNLVFEIENPVINGSGSGAVTWDTRSFSGQKVASGVYLALITSKEGEQTKVGKLLIIR